MKYDVVLQIKVISDIIIVQTNTYHIKLSGLTDEIEVGYLGYGDSLVCDVSQAYSHLI